MADDGGFDIREADKIWLREFMLHETRKVGALEHTMRCRRILATMFGVSVPLTKYERQRIATLIKAGTYQC